MQFNAAIHRRDVALVIALVSTGRNRVNASHGHIVSYTYLDMLVPQLAIQRKGIPLETQYTMERGRRSSPASIGRLPRQVCYREAP